MMTVWHYYEQATGMLTGRCITCDRAFAEANAAPGHAVITGVRDWRTQRVDLATGDLVPHRPADDDWQRWVPGSEGGFVSEPTSAAVARAEREVIRRRIVELEEAAARPQRELLLNPRDAAARQRLAAVDAAIAALRDELQRVDGQAAPPRPPEP